VRWPYASRIALATSATAWPAAGYGALVIWMAGDLSATGTQWLFRWPFLAQLLSASTLHLLAVGFGVRLGIPPLFHDLVALDDTLARRDRLAEADPSTLRAALRAVVRFPVWNGWIGITLALLVTAGCAGLEALMAGPGSPNLWVIVRGGLYATALYGAASLALGELLTRPACLALRSTAVAAGIEPYDGVLLARNWRLLAMIVPTITALLVAAEIGLSPYGGGAGAYAALIALSAFVVVALGWLQYENSRSAVRELGRACQELATGHEVALITGSIEPLLVEMASQFNAAARRVDADRRDSGGRYRAVFEAALDCIISMDHDGRILEFNPAAEQTFGYTRAEVVGKPLVDAIIPPALRAAHRHGLERYLRGGEARVLGKRVELPAMRADGSEFPIELAVTEILRDGPSMFTAHLRDITARRRAEEALTASRQRIEEEAEIAAALLRVTQTINADLGRADMLEEVTRLAVEVLHCDWGSLYVWDERREAFRLRANAGARPEMRAEVEQIDFTADSFPIVREARVGQVLELPDYASQGLIPPGLMQRWEIASLLAAPIARGDQVVGSLTVGYRTRTGPFSAKQHRIALGIAHAAATALANSRLIADLEAANRLKSEFVSTMSHELRSPLNVILGFAEMARDRAMGPPEREDCIGRIEAAGRELLTLIESTLEIGKLEAGRLAVRLEEVPLPAFWAELGRGCAILPRSRDVALEWGRDVPDLSLVTDPRKLTIIMRNLVGNALKFTERGHVRADVRLDGDSVMLEVADTGIGIRREDQEAIFEMFRQADGSDTRRYGGTGLGLYIVRRFVEQLGGRVGLESVPGRGSTFTIRLPVFGSARPYATPPRGAVLDPVRHQSVG
jgi:PAS domain S-box-containing protein